MDLDITDLPDDFARGLKELSRYRRLSLSGSIGLTAVRGEAGIKRTADGYRISYLRECEFYREFVKLINGETQCTEHCVFDDLAVMVDCSRNAVLNVDAVKRLIRLCACMGYGTLMLYTEDTYEIDGEPFFGYMRGRYSKAELKEVDAYGRMFGVELVPCIQTLAHLNGIARWDRFEPIIDCNDILLAGDERTYGLIDKMFGTLAECFTSRRVHIGMDEAHMVGLGKYLDEHGYENRFDILLKHLNRALETADRYGFSCTMWSDMFFRLANGGKYEPTGAVACEDIKKYVPQNVTLMYWDYYRNDGEYYDKMLDAHKVLCDNISFACGAWRWNGFTPSNTMSVSRNRLAFDACKKHGVKQAMITLWGDDGGECSTFAALPALVASAEYAYGNRDCERAFGNVVGASYSDFVSVELAEAVTGGGAFYGGNVTKVFLYNDPLCGLYDYAVKPEYKRKFLYAAEQNRAAAKRVKDYAYIFRTVAALCELVGNKCDLGVRLRAAYANGDKARLKELANEISSLVRLLDKFYRAYKKQWYAENKPFGFEIQDVRLGGLRQRLLHCKEAVCDYANGKTDTIAELETQILPLQDIVCSTELRTDRRWKELISVNRL